MEFLIEYTENFLDADGYTYVEHADIELTAECEQEAIELFNDRYPNTAHFDYEINKVRQLADNDA